jgi:hypothetical protein
MIEENESNHQQKTASIAIVKRILGGTNKP